MALTEHISDEILNRYEARKAAPAENLVVQTHIGECKICREKLARISSPTKAFAAVRRSFALDNSDDFPEHLAYEQLEFLVDDKLDEVEREIAESHLSFCGECATDLIDLQKYRELAAATAASTIVIDAPQKSFWSKFFAFDSIGSFAPVAAILLVALAFGAWLLLRKTNDEIALGNLNKSIPAQAANDSNIKPAINLHNENISPETVPSPEISPSADETTPDSETLYALNDGQLKVDVKGGIKGAENLSPAAQSLIKQSLQNGKVSVTANALGGGGGVLMGGGNADNGVPFALQTPIGKVIRESQPVLQWKPLKDAANYSVAIVDEKFKVVETSGKLTTTSWKPSKPLPRGANYSWQVTATLADGTETVSPSSPAPQARFRVIEQSLFDDINKAEKSADRSHLALGVLYAKVGLKQQARLEFEKLVKENPNSTLARKLLQSVR